MRRVCVCGYRDTYALALGVRTNPPNVWTRSDCAEDHQLQFPKFAHDVFQFTGQQGETGHQRYPGNARLIRHVAKRISPTDYDHRHKSLCSIWFIYQSLRIGFMCWATA